MAEIGDRISLKNQEVEVEGCKKCEHKMVNLDADELAPGDLSTLKAEGVRISNPETEAPICVNCEHRTFSRAVSDWFEREDDNDDSSFFSTTGSFMGSLSSGGFGGGFGGFGGGGFGGGGASRSF